MPTKKPNKEKRHVTKAKKAHVRAKAKAVDKARPKVRKPAKPKRDKLGRFKPVPKRDKAGRFKSKPPLLGALGAYRDASGKAASKRSRNPRVSKGGQRRKTLPRHGSKASASKHLPKVPRTMADYVDLYFHKIRDRDYERLLREGQPIEGLTEEQRKRLDEALERLRDGSHSKATFFEEMEELDINPYDALAQY